MKQIIQSYRTGKLTLSEVPIPNLSSGQVLVQTAFSAVSLGTEGKKVTTARQSLLGKAKARPDLVKQVIQTAKKEGIISTYYKVKNRLDEPVPLGYSSAGVVIATAANVEDFQVGDRVACGGTSAAHAEIITVPTNLCVKIPNEAKLEYAAFSTIGAIALQGVRQAEITLGETVAVIGLGLVGQLTVQLLKANGCRVIGIDLDPFKVEMAQKLGADLALTRNSSGLEAAISHFSRGRGIDATLITAATSSNDPAELAVEIARDRGRIIIVGSVRLDLPRDACYYKELEVKLSRSYGPGRYDPNYEEKGVDYPIGYVRWTEKRNMEAFLDLVAADKLNLADLITHRFSFDQAEEAYALVSDNDEEDSSPLGIIFEYDTTKAHLDQGDRKIYTSHAAPSTEKLSQIGVGFIGAGSFARKFLIPPVMKHDQAHLIGVSTATGISGQTTAEKFNFKYSTGDHQQVLNDEEVNAVFVATRHNLHSQLVIEALKAGKSVFVEKPLALTQTELDEVVQTYQQLLTDEAELKTNGTQRREQRLPLVQVGFNRRFAPMVQHIKESLAERAEPLVAHYRINAGFIKGDHWVHDLEQGGGRILGEVCHFVDLVIYLVGHPVTSVYAVRMDNVGRYHNDNVSISLTFADGSIAHILYVANGDTALDKEHLEVFCQGRTAILDDFYRLILYRSGQRELKRSSQNKGYDEEVNAFIHSVLQGGPESIPFAELVMSTQATLKIIESLQLGQPVTLT